MSFPKCRIIGLAVATAILGHSPLRADVITLNPSADTTLIQVDPNANLGGADFFNAGTPGNGNRNRALMVFSLSEFIPAGATINNVSLVLDIVRQPAVDIAPALFSLRRVQTSWSEGDKVPIEEGSPGLGAPATEGDATWLYRSVGGEAWSAPGGRAGVDFSGTPSSTAFVYGIGDPVQFESTPLLTADVQFWLDNPSSNFGWMLMTETEEVRKSARSFASREDANGGPMLIIDFTPVPEPGTITLAGLLGLGLLVARRVNRR
ncbi:MAG: DNRLRE domain-containing protein [Verrucomicrobia bacterium]|nr:DNRLRE domain-containing protein [Verrucomicrobiota bacterium]